MHIFYLQKFNTFNHKPQPHSNDKYNRPNSNIKLKYTFTNFDQDEEVEGG